jgi:acetoin utilization protein AcuC
MLPDPRERPVLIGSEIYRGSTYGPKHPLAIPRVSTTLDLIRAMSWLDESRYLDSPAATPEELTRFHTPDYVAALMRAEAEQRVDEAARARHHIGAHGNPVYREVFRRPATGAGGTMLAARLTASGGAVHVPGGGTHHGRPDRASGFCYLNDAVLGLMSWLDQGLTNVLYLDLDAHHGDGVQDAFHDDPRVFTVSVHEAGRWPHTGAAEDRGRRPCAQPAGAGGLQRQRDGLGAAARDPAAAAAPAAAGRDAPVRGRRGGGRPALAPRALQRLPPRRAAGCPAARAAADRPGGGGYNPWSVARCWAGLWAELNGLPIPMRVTPAAEAVLRGLAWSRSAGRNPPEHWFTTIADTPRPGPVRRRGPPSSPRRCGPAGSASAVASSA